MSPTALASRVPSPNCETRRIGPTARWSASFARSLSAVQACRQALAMHPANDKHTHPYSCRSIRAAASASRRALSASGRRRPDCLHFAAGRRDGHLCKNARLIALLVNSNRSVCVCVCVLAVRCIRAPFEKCILRPAPPIPQQKCIPAPPTAPADRPGTPSPACTWDTSARPPPRSTGGCNAGGKGGCKPPT